jgi:hypothetical protein
MEHEGFPFFSPLCHERWLAANPPQAPLKDNGKPKRSIEECIQKMREYGKQRQQMLI